MSFIFPLILLILTQVTEAGIACLALGRRRIISRRDAVLGFGRNLVWEGCGYGSLELGFLSDCCP